MNEKILASQVAMVGKMMSVGRSLCGCSYRGRGDPCWAVGSSFNTVGSSCIVGKRIPEAAAPAVGRGPKHLCPNRSAPQTHEGETASGCAGSPGSVWECLFRETVGEIPKSCDSLHRSGMSVSRKRDTGCRQSYS